MNRIRIFSHDQAVRHYPAPRTGIIRLFDSEALLGESDVRNEPLSHEAKFEKVFVLTVDDIQRSLEDEYPGSVLFSDKHASYLKEVFHECADLDEVIVHCRAGVSRSAAVAILFARYLNRLDLECSLYVNHNIYPNAHILSFQEKMGIAPWSPELQPLLNRLTKQMIEADHESMLVTIEKLGIDWRELITIKE